MISVIYTTAPILFLSPRYKLFYPSRFRYTRPRSPGKGKNEESEQRKKNYNFLHITSRHLHSVHGLKRNHGEGRPRAPCLRQPMKREPRVKIDKTIFIALSRRIYLQKSHGGECAISSFFCIYARKNFEPSWQI